MKHRISRDALPAFASLLVVSTLIGACSDSADDPTGNASGGVSGAAADVSTSSGGSGTSSGGSSTSGDSDARSETGGVAAADGGSTGSGGTKMTTGGASPGTGGSGPSTGGNQATGGTGPSTGGTSPSTGGTSPSTGGTSPSTGGTSPSVGGSDATGGTAPATGGTDSSTGGNETPATVVIGSQRSGEATYYNGSGTVNCSYEGITDSMNIAALNTADYGNAQWCGACARVEGPNGDITVRIVDQCPSCAAGDLDLSPTAFDQIADHSAGRVNIAWTFVSCDVTGPVTYFFKEGSSEGWTAILVENHRLPITKMEWSKDQTSWTEMPRETYNYFLEASGFGSGGAYVRITATDGQQLVDRLPLSREYLLIEGAANFE